jgi:hypothetical protein
MLSGLGMGKAVHRQITQLGHRPERIRGRLCAVFGSRLADTGL